MEISQKAWSKYIQAIAKLDTKAADMIKDWVNVNGLSDRQKLIDYTFTVVNTLSLGSGALAVDWYNAVAELEGVIIPSAEMAELPTYGDVAKTVNGVMKRSLNVDAIASAASNLVKRTAADTTLKNAQRDGAEFAWIPMGDTCAFCLQLASYGWRTAGKKTLNGSHAEHIHANCDCEYGIRFGNDLKYASYNPDKYTEMFENAEGETDHEKMNSIRRMQYQENKDRINAQKREAYALREKLGQHKDGDKVFITDQAINKVKDVAPSFFSAESKEMVKELNQEILRVSRSINNSDEVAMAIVDGVIGKPVLGGDSSVNLFADPDMYHALKSKEIEPHSVVLSHNHPGLSYFSVHDVGIFAQHPNIGTMEVVTNTGKTWYISKKDNYDDIKAFDLYKKAISENSNNPEMAVDSFLKSVYNMIERNK